MSIADKLRQIAENEQKVYEAGYEKGNSEADTSAAYNEGFDAGKKAEYDRFWDALQENGTREDYWAAFAGGWTDEIFKPKYPLNNVTSCSYMFRYSKMTRIPKLCLNISEVPQVFYEAQYVETIESLVFLQEATSFSSTFTRANALKNLVIEGTISGGGFNVQWSVELSKNSITSIINALSATTSGLTVTLSKAAVNAAFETASGANDGVSSAEWAALIATKPNWTISLV